MARMARVVVSGYPHHVTQHGNRRQKTFRFSPSEALKLYPVIAIKPTKDKDGEPVTSRVTVIKPDISPLKIIVGFFSAICFHWHSQCNGRQIIDIKEALINSELP